MKGSGGSKASCNEWEVGLAIQDRSLLLEMYYHRGELRFYCPEAGKGRPHHASIPRWHFDMVLDEQRNHAYDAAIKRAVELRRAGENNGVKVLDIGTGSGILSLMAARQASSPSESINHIAGWPLQSQLCEEYLYALTQSCNTTARHQNLLAHFVIKDWCAVLLV